MPLVRFFERLLAEKHANACTLVQDNPTRSANPSTVYKEASEVQTKERPSLAKSSDSIAPKPPLRQTSDEELEHLPSTRLSRSMMGGSPYQNEIFASSKTATSSSSEEESKQTHPMNEDSVFASFCDETKGILMQLPSSRFR